MRQCTKCRINKEETKDNFYQRRNGSFDARCRDCNALSSRKYYGKNKDKEKKRTTSRRKSKQNEARAYLLDYLQSHPCIDCGEANILTLEFDHIDSSTKIDNVSNMVIQGRLLKDIKCEVNKCEVRCANCHKIKTAQQQTWYKYLVKKE